jgi:hypothetical protein
VARAARRPNWSEQTDLDFASGLYFRGNSDDVFVEKIAGCP